MSAQKIEELKSKIDIISLLKYTGNKVYENGKVLADGTRQWIGCCPFHATGEDEFLEINPEAKTTFCGWCEKSWDMVEYVKKLKKFTQDNQIIAFLEKYQESVRPKERYRIEKNSAYEIVIKIDDRFYQITGYKLGKLNNFSMTLKLSHKDKVYIDDVRLNRRRSRASFVEEARDILFISEELLDDDLYLLMDALEKLQREYIERREKERFENKKVFIYTPEEAGKAVDMLGKRDVLTELLLDDLEKMFYVGDETIKYMLYLAATSRLLAKPVNILLVANSSAGKSMGQDMVLVLFPEDEVYSYTRITPNSLSHYPKNALRHKIMCVDELAGIDEEAFYQMRSLLSKGSMAVGYTSMDKINSRMETLSKEVYGPISMITSTTHDELINDETRSRFLILTLKNSAGKTRRIMDMMTFRRTRKGLFTAGEKGKIIRKHKLFQKVIRPVQMVIPDNWQKKLKFNNEKLIYRRKYEGYLSLLEAVVLLRQYQRKVYTEKDAAGKYTNYVYVKKEDIAFVNSLARAIFSNEFGSLSPVNKNLLEMVSGFCQKKAQQTKLKYYDVLFTRRDIREYTGWDHTPVRRAIEKLVELEYILRVFSSERGKHHYKLNMESDDDSPLDTRLRLWKP
ncbi:MAG TPA: CHC2 zinc finger domain-containing protein [Spirochaetota bacterium]|nr:CHC2 zinc finger domain-containing protein [Spirochaetota bacterium]